MSNYQSFRDRDRRKYHAVGGSYARAERELRAGNRPARAPVARRSRRAKTPPNPPVACFVKDARGVPYTYDEKRRILYQSESLVHVFSSRRKASAAIWRTIEHLKSTGTAWEGKEFFRENAP